MADDGEKRQREKRAVERGGDLSLCEDVVDVPVVGRHGAGDESDEEEGREDGAGQRSADDSRGQPAAMQGRKT